MVRTACNVFSYQICNKIEETNASVLCLFYQSGSGVQSVNADVCSLGQAPLSPNEPIVACVDDFVVRCAACFSFFSKTDIFKAHYVMYCKCVFESDYQFFRSLGNKGAVHNLPTYAYILF